MKSKFKRGFSLAELVLAIGLFAVAILSILGLSILVGKTNQEGDDRLVGEVVGGILLDRVVDQVRSDSPAGTADDFWNNEHVTDPWDESDISNGGTEYKYRITAQSVFTSSGVPVGGSTPNNRLKKVDVTVWWWDSDTQQRQGYGKLQVSNSRLVSEGEL
jgi:Tfp pilus assembly protein PilV